MSNTLNHISNITTGQKYYTSGTNQTDYAVGDLLTGTVLQGGEHPVVEMNGTPVQVRSNALKDAQTGDRIYLRITVSNSSEITLKLIDQQEQSIYTRSGTMQTEIRRNTARFVDTWNETCPDADTQAGQLKEDAEEVSRSLSEEERAKLRQMGIEVSASNITFIKSLLSQMRGKEQDEQLQQAIDSVRKQIIIEQPDEHPEAFRMVVGDTSFNLPDALNQLNDQLPLTKEQAVYFIQNQASFSPDELYKSAYSSKSMPTRKAISDEDFAQLLPQIDRTLQAAGLDITQEQHDASRFLLEYQLPVTTDSLLTYQAVQDLNTNGFTMDNLRTHMEDLIAESAISTGASDTSITVSDMKHLFENSDQYFPAPSKVADAIMDDLNRITDTDMAAFAASGLPYTLEALSAFSRQHAATSGSNVSSDVTSAATISNLTAHRQLEELRLKMTWSAGYALASEDLHIRTRDLTQVVDALREQETAAYRQQMAADGILPTNTEIALIQETSHKLAELPALPAAAIGRTWASGSFTIQRLHADGIQALSEYRTSSQDALNSYETMMTTPRSDMGDSIHKAFRNVDPILNELQLPVTEANARAVRILGYNRMELTPENISQVKAADQEVQTLIRNLQPSVVLHLVEDGINPLNMPIQELNAIAEEYIADADVASDEKYSTFLQKLDRCKQISREERTGYIGIYRLIDKITRSQGKDIGTLVRNGQDLTLQNLLTAHRSNRSTGMDTTVDETFGGIDVQTAGTNDSVANDIQSQIERGTQTAYRSQLVKSLRDALSPDIIDSMVQESASGVTLEEFLDRIEKQLTTEVPTGSSTPAAESMTEAMADHIPDLSAFDGTDYQLMQDLQLLPTINNMEALLQLTKGNGIFFQNLSNTIQSLDGSADTARRKLSQLDEALSSPEAMEAAYSDLAQTASTAAEATEQAGTITARDIQALKQIRSGLRILEKMSRREQYQIPMEMDGEWGVLHLSVIQNSGKNRSLQASLPTRQYGLLQANLEWNGTDWDTTLTAERSEGVAFLEQNQDAFATALDAITRTAASAGNTTSAGTTSPEAPDTAVDDKHPNSDTAPSTDEMYQIAKKLVVFFRHILK